VPGSTTQAVGARELLAVVDEVAEADSSGKTEDGGPRLEQAAGRSLTDDDRAGRVGSGLAAANRSLIHFSSESRPT
jgi:hypothetical protein